MRRFSPIALSGVAIDQKNRLVALDQKLIFFNILLKEKTLSSYVTEGVALNRLGIMVVQSELKNNKNWSRNEFESAENLPPKPAGTLLIL